MTKLIYAGMVSMVLLVLGCTNSPKKDKEGGDQERDTSGQKGDTSVSMNIQKEDTLSNQVEPYDYDTTLKGGHNLSFKVDDSLEYLFLRTGSVLKEISSCAKGLPYKNLGYKSGDFTDYFVLAHSFGAGNSTHIELIDKKTGRNILENDAVWIDADEPKQLLLYYLENDTKKDELVLYDVKGKQRSYYSLPREIANVPIPTNDIRIDTITDAKLVIVYSSNGVEKKKSYERTK